MMKRFFFLLHCGHEVTWWFCVYFNYPQSSAKSKQAGSVPVNKMLSKLGVRDSHRTSQVLTTVTTLLKSCRRINSVSLLEKKKKENGDVESDSVKHSVIQKYPQHLIGTT